MYCIEKSMQKRQTEPSIVISIEAHEMCFNLINVLSHVKLRVAAHHDLDLKLQDWLNLKLVQ